MPNNLYKPNKSLGQNFMLSDEISSYMVQSLNLASSDVVVEIGSGLGAVTQKLSEQLFEHISRIYAVEIDERFISKLEEMFRQTLNVAVITADILQWLPQQLFEKDFKVLGSLPYYITSPILHMLVKLPKRPEKAVLLIQKEVAENLVEKAPRASYLSSFLQTFFEVTYLKTVPKGVFTPVPKVDGAIICLDKKPVDEMFNDLQVVEKYEKFLHRGYSHPRKMLNKPFSKEELAKTGINGNLRPHDLDVSVWQDMFKSLVF
jgi:16S rRNA (adenine1518-N6/adenine1519-N6)-dimethyltransferase